MIKRYLKWLYQGTARRSTDIFYSLMERKKGARLLDLGCWDGENSMKYAGVIGTKNVAGIELVKSKAIQAKKRGLTVYIGNLNDRFPLPGRSVDVAIAYHVIEHLVNTEQFIAEVYRVLDRDGYALIGTPNLASWHNVFALLMGMQPFSGPHIKDNTDGDMACISKMNDDRMQKVFNSGKKMDKKKQGALRHVVVMTTRSLKRALTQAGFQIEAVKGAGYYPFPELIGRFFAWIDPYHAHYQIIKARKVK